ncbi:MAG: hypothetical protein JNN07_13755 [Verrucomicrobiales bacterium]|nr:hypothetical protein [Verrucomicrobiales bacterium]
MKRLFLLISFGGLLPWSKAIAAENPWWGHFGYRYVSGIDYTHSHDTHPDDRWLQNGNLPGSAGTTHVSEAHVVQFGLGRDFSLPQNFVAWSSLDLGVGVNMDKRQNANDPRPPATGAFVFSWPLWLADVGLGVGYNLGRVRVGAEARGGGLLILSGYDRYSSLDVQAAKWQWTYGLGPTVSVRVSDRIDLEGRALFGNVSSVTFSLAIHF